MTTPIPQNFELNALTENDRELSDRYDLTIKVVRRMRATLLVPSPVQRKMMRPADFNQHIELLNVALALHYGVGEKVIRRWRKEQKALDAKSALE